ncbi:MAG: hypothetical protein PHQ74_09790 [Crocinitomicaceae bacterium]|nr:hypothetical protein [Crocinitomicaceae bacterium]
MKTVLIAILISLTSFAFGQTADCKRFKEGKFVIPNAEYGNSYLERKGNIQTEIGEKSGFKATFKVKWIDECTYTLQLKKIINNPDEIVFDKATIITVKILEVKKNSYIQRSTSNTFDTVFEGEIFVND